MKKLILEVSKCTGCGQCELTCAFHNTETFDLQQSNIHIVQWEDICLSVPVVCQQCGDAQCIEICPTDALSWDPERHTITLEKEKCIQCEACVYECTYNVMHLTSEGYPATCDQCNGDPQCVKACFPGALTYVEVPEDAGEQFREVVRSLVERGEGKNLPPPISLRNAGDLHP